MHPSDCPGWEYATHKDVGVLDNRCSSQLSTAQGSQSIVNALLHDTRSTHETLFSGLTPASCSYYAGNYRGSNHRCLQHYDVYIDYYKGLSPADVEAAMQSFHQEANQLVQSIESYKAANRPSEAEYLLLISKALAEILVQFVVIHPFANGNGHMGRFLVWYALIRLRRYPRNWPLNSRPAYDTAIRLHREGFPDELETFILRAIKGR